ncbi:cytochrome c oxidase subunit II [Paracoccaceae bacterium GXU_MW_L88]
MFKGMGKTIAAGLTGAGAFAAAGVAAAQQAGTELLGDLPVIGAPAGGAATGFQPAATELARDVQWLDTMVMSIMIVIVLFVTGLMAWVSIRYNSRVNKEPARFSHNTPVEIAWTIIPVLILIVIGSFSLPVLFKQVRIPDPDLTIKATGYQWYWEYEYPDQEHGFAAYMLPKEDMAAYGYDEKWFQLAADNAVIVPTNANVKLLVTGGDVIHSWAMPAFGVKMDAIPGRLNETWFNVEQEGIYFGQCSELCGKDHAFMPITVKAVSQEKFDAYMNSVQQAKLPTESTTELASAE